LIQRANVIGSDEIREKTGTIPAFNELLKALGYELMIQKKHKKVVG
jgi:hypothetical protein